MMEQISTSLSPLKMAKKVSLHPVIEDRAHANHETEYTEDTAIIPRSTSVLARRLPPTKPGQGKAARYMTGKMPITAKNSSRKEQPISKSLGRPAANTFAPSQPNSNMTEEEQIAAMFQAQSEQWSAEKAEMAK